jgi:VCBS repeat protein/FG-GAP repeat protein
MSPPQHEVQSMGQRKSRRAAVEQLERRWLLSAAVVQSINRAVPAAQNTGSSSVTFTVTFSQPVTGVDATDFQVVTTGGVAASPTIFVSPVNPSVYNVGVFGISGSGTLGLNLVDDGTIRDGSNQNLGASTTSFAPQKTYAAGSYPRSVATADVNGDGFPDIVAADGNGLAIVLLGNGNGTFQAARTFACGTGSYSVAVADFNGDSKPDLVVSNSGSANFSLLLGNGNGTFQPQATFAVGQIPDSITVADVNGDGKMDVVTANYTASTVSVLLGNGDGTFQGQKTFATSGLPFAVGAADVNGDGKIDIMTANRGGGGSVGVALGNGDGTFKAQTTLSAPFNPSSVTAADVDSDGKQDLVVAADTAGGKGSAAVFYGNGDGTFSAPRTFATGGYPQTVVVADVNGDGLKDVVSANFFDGSASVLLNNGTGTFGGQMTFAAGHFSCAVAVADFNADGRPDIVTANQGSGSVSVLLGNSSGDFTGQAYNINSPGPLAVTLTGTPPASVVRGTKANFTQTVTVTNLGADTINQTVVEGLYLTSVGGVFDAGSVQLQSASRVLRIKPGGHVTFKVRVTSIPATIPSGDYSLVVNLNESGNSTVYGTSAQTISVEPAQISFGSSTLTAPASAISGKTLGATLTLKNAGNVKATGSLPMAVYASQDGLMDDARLLGNITHTVNLKPGASTRMALHGLNAPAAAGSYYLIVRIDADGTFKGDTDQGVIIATADPVLVS